MHTPEGGGGGVKVKNRDYVLHIVWCHPSQCAQVVGLASEAIEVWPVWLGLGPVSGTVCAMQKQGIQSPARLISNVLTTLATTTRVDKSQGFCNTQISEMRFEFPKEWEPGANTRVIFCGWKEGESWGDQWVPAPLFWICASLVVDLDASPVATSVIKN